MTLRNIATIYVFNAGHILLMHRVGSRLFKGSIWVGIGGHFEPEELSDPYRCALRELKEETGLLAEDIADLRLRYITTRKTESEIRQQYIFTAGLASTTARPIESDEGETHWIPLDALFQRKMAYSNTECLKHYLATGKATDDIYVGAVGAGAKGEGLSVQFTALREYGTDR